MLAAKAMVFAAVALVTGLVASFASFFIGQAILSTQAPQHESRPARTCCVR